MTTVKVYMPKVIGEEGLTVEFRKTTDGSLLTEYDYILVDEDDTGWFSVEVVAEWVVPLSALIRDSNDLLVRDGYLGVGKTIITHEFPVAGGEAEGNVNVVSFSGDALTYLNEKFSSTLGNVVVSIFDRKIDGFPRFLRKGDARTVQNGGALFLRIYAEDDESHTTPLLGTGSLLFSEANYTKFALMHVTNTTTPETVPEVIMDAEWITDDEDGYFLITYDETALDDATAYIAGVNKYHEWGIKVAWPSTPQPITIASGTTKVYNAIVVDPP
jgi:hypothetical protein